MRGRIDLEPHLLDVRASNYIAEAQMFHICALFFPVNRGAKPSSYTRIIGRAEMDAALSAKEFPDCIVTDAKKDLHPEVQVLIVN